MQFNQSHFNQFILDNNVITFSEQPIKLKSGRISHLYVNWRPVLNDAFLLERTAEYIISFIQSKKLDISCIYGVPEGATKLGIAASLKFANGCQKGTHIVPMGRAKPKEHGDPADRFFVGAPKGKTLVIEDVTTTGNSLMETIDRLRSLNIEVTAALALFNRVEVRDDRFTVEQAVTKCYNGEVKYYALSSALDLLPLAVKKKKPSKEVIKALEEEFKNYGMKPLKLT